MQHRVRVALLVLAMAVVLPLSASASIFGEENATLAAILSQDIAILEQATHTVTNLVQTVATLRTMVRRTETMLERKDPAAFYGVLDLASSTLRTYGSIDSDVRYIGYRLHAIDFEQNRTYQATLRGMPPAEFAGTYRNWNGALLESTRVAMRAQTNLETLQERAAVQKEILTNSQGTRGIVGQLQLVIQGLALLHSDLESVQRSLDTGMRVTANMAAGQAAASFMVDEQHRLSLENYTDPGPPVIVPDKLP